MLIEIINVTEYTKINKKNENTATAYLTFVKPSQVYKKIKKSGS